VLPVSQLEIHEFPDFLAPQQNVFTFNHSLSPGQLFASVNQKSAQAELVRKPGFKADTEFTEGHHLRPLAYLNVHIGHFLFGGIYFSQITTMTMHIAY
jgi:hypothetical protein